MRELYEKWYELAKDALNVEVENIREFKDIARIVFLGMGGSAIVGDFINTIAQDYSNYEIIVWRDFYIPKPLIKPRDTLYVVISYSGNTLETIKVFKCIEKHTQKIVVVTSNGKLLEYAKTKNVVIAKVPSGLVPRVALPAMLVSTIKVLADTGVEIVDLDIVRKSIEILKNVDEALTQSIYLASFLLYASIPVVVATTRYLPLAIRFKNELNENSKMPAKVEVAPELFHNDIVGWEASEVLEKVLIIPSDLPYENSLLHFYAEILSEKGFELREVPISGKNIIERLLYGALLAGFVSVRLAELRGIDPLKTESIAKYKEFVNKLASEIPE